MSTKRITTKCPFCSTKINAITPKEKGTGRFLIECTDCRKEICITLSRDAAAGKVDDSKALTKIEDMDGVGKGKGSKRDTSPDVAPRIIKRKRAFRGKPSPKREIPMEVIPECIPLIMELETEKGVSDKVYPPPNDEDEHGLERKRFMDREEEAGKQPLFFKKKERSGGGDVKKGSSRTSGTGYRKLSVYLFIIAFILGLFSLISIPMYTTDTVNPNENYSGENVHIMGVVSSSDDDGSLLADATVVLRELNKKTETNEEGYFFFEDVKEGIYTVSASKEGYATQTIQISVSGNSADSVINLHLNSGKGHEKIDLPISNEKQGRTYNSYFSVVVITSFCALGAGIFAHFSKMFYPTAILGIVAVASVGYVVGAICAVVGVLLFIYSKREF